MTTNDESHTPKAFEVWRMSFQYEDQPGKSKERPVVVAAVSKKAAEVLLLAVKVTSHAPRAEFPGEVVLLDWQQAGLEKPSVARCSKHLVVPIEVLHGQRKYGQLSSRDCLAVLSALKEVKAPLL